LTVGLLQFLADLGIFNSTILEDFLVYSAY